MLSHSSALVYDRLLPLSIEVTWDRELEFLTSSPEWLEAETVLDLGAGNGAYGRRLAEQFPEKHFVGMEPDPAIYAVGSRACFPLNYSYRLGQLDSGTLHERFDVLLMRLVLMYVADRPSLYDWARDHVDTVVVMNSEDAANSVIPDMPLVGAALVRGLSSRDDLARTAVGERDLSLTPIEWAAAGFVLQASSTVVYELSTPSDRRIVHHLLRLEAELMTPDSISLPLLNELFKWSTLSEARCTFGMTYQRFRNPTRMHRGAIGTPALQEEGS